MLASVSPTLTKKQEQIPTVVEGALWWEVGGFGVTKWVVGLGVETPLRQGYKGPSSPTTSPPKWSTTSSCLPSPPSDQHPHPFKPLLTVQTLCPPPSPKSPRVIEGHILISSFSCWNSQAESSGSNQQMLCASCPTSFWAGPFEERQSPRGHLPHPHWLVCITESISQKAFLPTFLKAPFKTHFKEKAADQTVREMGKDLGEGHPERFPCFILHIHWTQPSFPQNTY